MVRSPPAAVTQPCAKTAGGLARPDPGIRIAEQLGQGVAPGHQQSRGAQDGAFAAAILAQQHGPPARGSFAALETEIEVDQERDVSSSRGVSRNIVVPIVTRGHQFRFRQFARGSERASLDAAGHHRAHEAPARASIGWRQRRVEIQCQAANQVVRGLRGEKHLVCQIFRCPGQLGDAQGQFGRLRRAQRSLGKQDDGQSVSVFRDQSWLRTASERSTARCVATWANSLTR